MEGVHDGRICEVEVGEGDVGRGVELARSHVQQSIVEPNVYRSYASKQFTVRT